MAIEQGGIFIVPHLFWHGTSVFEVSSKGSPRLVALYDKQELMRTFSNPGPRETCLKVEHFKKKKKTLNTVFVSL